MSVAFSPTPTRSSLGKGFTMGSVEAGGPPEGCAANQKQRQCRRDQQNGRPPMESHARRARHTCKEHEDGGGDGNQDPVPYSAWGPDFSRHLLALHAGL